MAKVASSGKQDLEILAGEYVVGVSSAQERLDFEKRSAADVAWHDAKMRWENRLQALNSDYQLLAPPISVKKRIDKQLFQSAAADAETRQIGGLWSSLVFWRSLGFAGTAAAILLGVYGLRLNEGLTGARIELTASLEEKARIEGNLQAFEAELASRGQQLASLETEVASNAAKLKEADTLLAQAKAELTNALSRETPLLVVSLESGDTDYRFLAVHEEGSDKVRMTLVSGDVDQQKDFELWLVEPQKDTVSLGVIAPGRSAVELTPEFAAILEKGGLLAVSIEQKGGSPTGVAQGPVVAVGAPREL